MFPLLAILVGVLFAAGVYLMLGRSMVRIIFGIVLVGHAVNLLIFTSGGLVRAKAPIVPPGETAPLPGYADPVPQALVLTAIVIGFALTAFLAVRYSAPVLAASGGGSIVCISSDAAKLVFPWLPAYTTGKSALEGFVRAAAEELSRFGIRVNAVRPGLTRTDATQAMTDAANQDYQRAKSGRSR